MSKLKRFAQLDENNIVQQIVVINKGTDTECKKWLESRVGGSWVLTYSLEEVSKGNEKAHTKKPAGIGYHYDEESKEFIPPQPFNSWVLDKDLTWQPPVALPDFEKKYFWDEEIISWVEVSEETN